MELHFIRFVGIILSTIPIVQSQNTCNNVSSRTYTLNPEQVETTYVNKRTHYAGKSTNWTFHTQPGGYLSVFVSEFNLGTEDCITKGKPDYQRGPLLTFVLYNVAGVPREHRMCPTRPIYKPLLSFNKAVVVYCKGPEDVNFTFTVVSKIAGIIQASNTMDVRPIKSSSEVQWIGLTLNPSEILDLQLHSVSVKKGSNGGCKRSFISIKDVNDNSILPNNTPLICNKYKTPLSIYNFTVYSTEVNITFRRASFILKFKLKPKNNEVEPRVIETITSKTTTPYYTSSYKKATIENKSKSDTQIYQFIGAGIAGLVIVLIVIFACCKINRRRAKNKKRKMSSKPPQEGVYNSTVTVLPPGEGATSLNNAMYEKTLKGKISSNGNDTDRAIGGESSIESLLTVEKQLTNEDVKRRQRLSHLEDKYIGFTPRPKPPSYKSGFTQSTERPKLAIPAVQNQYEQIISPDLVPPSYMTISEDGLVLPEDRNEINELSENCPPKLKPKQKNKLTNLSTDDQGYLAVTDSQDIPGYSANSFIAANFAKQKDATSHFIAVENKTQHTLSMPNLSDDLAGCHNRSQSHKNYNKMNKKLAYDHPRPSAPNIFIKCAYTSSDDLANIRTHLQQVADSAKLNQSENSIAPNCKNGVLYDSPQPSTSSVNRLSATPCHVSNKAAMYDEPRPSLPNIFPGDLRRYQQT